MANSNSNSMRFVTYNTHSWNSGLSGLLELCNDPTICKSGCRLFNNLHPDFVGFGLSSMNNRLSRPTEIYRGRPFGDVGFLWRKSISNNVQIISKAASGRSLCILLECTNHRAINVVTSSHEYTSQLADSLSFIEHVLSLGVDTAILGDMNFECTTSNLRYRECYALLSKFNVFHCDEYLTSGTVTYRNESLGQSSFIDHVRVNIKTVWWEALCGHGPLSPEPGTEQQYKSVYNIS